MQIRYTYKAAQQLESLPLSVQNRIYEKMTFYAEQPNPLHFAKYITQESEYRFRVGDYRLRFEVKESIIIVRTIQRRDKAYD